MKKTALYVHGYGSTGETSGTGKVVRQILDELGYDVYTFEYDYENVARTTTDIYNENWVKYDLIVAHSLGSFFSFSISRPPRMILINPCMKPHQVIPMSPSLTGDYMDQSEEIEYMEFSKKELDNIIPIFSKDDEVCNFRKFFEEKKFTNILEIDGGHRPTYDQLKGKLAEAVEI